MQRCFVGVCSAALAILALAGCGQAAPPTAAQEYCQSLTGLSTALGNLTTVTPSTTAEQVQGNVTQVRSAWGKVAASASHAQQARRTDLDQAYTEFQRTVANLPSAATPAQNAQTVGQAMTTFRTSVSTIRADYKCA